LAGPVVAAAVIMPAKLNLKGLDDSKKVPAAKREDLFKKISEKAKVGVGIVGPDEIDRINILQATFMAMRQAISNLKHFPDYILVDGNQMIPRVTIDQRCIIDGDACCRSIAAASIIAKVTRDRIMRELSEKYPVYGFSKHKGYGTAEHIEAIMEHGPSPIHRRSFNLSQQLSFFDGPEEAL
jgi:ribonuclease HII